MKTETNKEEVKETEEGRWREHGKSKKPKCTGEEKGTKQERI
jgi:hypothetical protein